MNLKFWKRTPAQPPLPQWSTPYDESPLKARLGALPPNDPLYPLLLGYLDAAIVAHAGLPVPPEMAGQFVGKLNALDDLRSNLARLWHAAHQPPDAAKVGRNRPG